MNRESMIFTLLLVVGGVILLVNGLVRNAGASYVRITENTYVRVVNPATPGEQPTWMPLAAARALGLTDLPAAGSPDYISWESETGITPKTYNEERATAAQPDLYRFSLARTLGVWAAGLFTLAIFSFLYRDNPLYKIAEAVLVGVSAAYWMVVGFWDVIVPNLLGKLLPDPVRNWSMPGLEEDTNLWYLVPLVLGVMLLWRLSPKGNWIARWPLAFIIGTTAGLRLVAFIHGDFLAQINNGILPLYVKHGDAFNLWDSLKNFFLVFGCLVCLVYFFFSVEHKGVVGKTARVGIWVLMITFGAGFGYTVMGRIALLAIRLEFLFDDFLWLIDPENKRAMLTPILASAGLL